jgi:hypothetical protein
MIAVAGVDGQGEGCSSTRRCGNVTISQPFWLRGIQTGTCGLLDFEVSCNNSITPILRSYRSSGFAIIDILYEEHSLHVVDIYDKNASGFCYVPSWNTSYKLGRPFQISTANLNLFLYNCAAEAAAVARRDSKVVPMRCGKESNADAFVSVGGFYNATNGNAGDAIRGCNATVVPVLGSKSGTANASDYEQLISDGFLMTWDPSDPPPVASKFAHPSNHLSIKFLAKTSAVPLASF